MTNACLVMRSMFRIVNNAPGSAYIFRVRVTIKGTSVIYGFLAVHGNAGSGCSLSSAVSVSES